MTKRNSSGLRNAGAIATVAALTLGMAGPGVMTATADENTANGNTGNNASQVVPEPKYTTTVAGVTVVTFTKDSTGGYTATVPTVTGKLQDHVPVTGPGGFLTSLNLTRTPNKNDTSVVGEVKVSGSAIYTGQADNNGPKFTVNIAHYEQTYGQAVQWNKENLTDGQTIDLGTSTLPADNNPTDQLDFAGSKTGFKWGAAEWSNTNGASTVTRTGTTSRTVTLKDDTAGINQKWTVNFTKKAVRTDAWTTHVNGKNYTFQLDKDDTAKATFDEAHEYPGSVHVTGSSSFDMNPTPTFDKADPSEKLGQLDVSGTASYMHPKDDNALTPAFEASMPFSYTSGNPIGIDGPSKALLKGSDGKTYYQKYSNFTLDNSNNPNTDELKLSDGKEFSQAFKIDWAKDANGNPAVEVAEQKAEDGTTSVFVRRKGTVDGTVTVKDPASHKSVDVPIHIAVTADRAQDKSFTGLTVTRTDATGKATVYDGAKDFNAKFNPDTHEYTLTLPADAVGDSYTLGLTHGVDAQASKPTLTLGEGASRVLKVNVNGADYTVNVKFQPADLKADSPAKLTGLYVNKTGENTKGDLIDNWDPNRLDYVLALGEKEPSPYVLPEAPDGVTIKGGNITQNAQSTRQEWTVTDTATGTSRIYSLTVTRPVKTAVTEFKPADPAKQASTVDPANQQDTALASHGYTDKTGKYVTSDKDSYIIPEGGTFAYTPKNGQSATVTVAHEGMTYTYTVNVLAPDGATFAQHTYTVTYITAATHKAQLTGILVDGTAVNGFDPAKHEYAASVNDPDEWMVSPQYDKVSGMTVSTEKKGADATITVTSGDGLVKTTYKVHVTRKPFGGNGNNALGLASTGVGIGWVGWLIGMLAIIGGALGITAVTRKTKSNDADESSEPEPGNDATPSPDRSQNV